MKRDDWYNSTEFVRHRFLNNLVAGVGHNVQQLGDALALFVETHPDIIFTDKYALVERQSKVLRLESDKLWKDIRALIDTVTPKEFDKE